MDLYCVMGNPVAHSKSPWIHTRFAALTRQTLHYTRMLIALDGFAQGVREFRSQGGQGCNITMPFKFQAASLPNVHLTARARLAGAANVLTFHRDLIEADNTDGIGLVRDITGNAGVALAGRRLLLVGAGGAGSGVLGPLIEAGPASITIANRTEDKAARLAASHAALAAEHGVQLQACGLQSPGAAFDVVINASASSMDGQAAPVPATVLREGTLAVDLVYGPGAQGFILWAQAHGAQGRDGLGMLVEQAAEAYRIWRGVMPPAAQVLAELRAELEAGTA